MEAPRVLRTFRSSTLTARTATIIQIKGKLITAPAPVKSRYEGLSNTTLAATRGRLEWTAWFAHPNRTQRLGISVRELVDFAEPMPDEESQRDLDRAEHVAQACA